MSGPPSAAETGWKLPAMKGPTIPPTKSKKRAKHGPLDACRAAKAMVLKIKGMRSRRGAGIICSRRDSVSQPKQKRECLTFLLGLASADSERILVPSWATREKTALRQRRHGWKS